jgi:hypothetical protein
MRQPKTPTQGKKKMWKKEKKWKRKKKKSFPFPESFGFVFVARKRGCLC